MSGIPDMTSPDGGAPAAPVAPAVAPAPAAPAPITTPPADPAAPAPVAPAAPSVDPDASLLGGDPAAPAADPAAPAEPAAGVPDKYELAAPEGFSLDPAAVEAAAPVFKEAGLTNEQANKLMPAAKDFAERTAQATIDGIIEQGQAQRATWLKEFDADAEIGGQNKETTLHLAAKGLDAMGYKDGHPFRKAMNDTGFGNHPDMIRVFRRLGQMAGEDGFVTGGGAPMQKPDQASTWYGKPGK